MFYFSDFCCLILNDNDWTEASTNFYNDFFYNCSTITPVLGFKSETTPSDAKKKNVQKRQHQ